MTTDAEPLNGYVHVTCNGPFITMDSDRWDELKRKLKRYGFAFIEDRPAIDGRAVRRLYKSRPGPKSAPKRKSK